MAWRLRAFTAATYSPAILWLSRAEPILVDSSMAAIRMFSWSMARSVGFFLQLSDERPLLQCALPARTRQRARKKAAGLRLLFRVAEKGPFFKAFPVLSVKPQGQSTAPGPQRPAGGSGLETCPAKE